MSAPPEHKRNLTQKNQRGPFYSFNSFAPFVPASLSRQRPRRKKQNSIVYIIQKITGGCLTPEQKALDPPKKGKMGY